jgi:pimeloyl-ACP methyl ester carboxylesterase
LAPILSPHFDVIAVDLPGCGVSDKPLDVSYSVKHHAEILEGVVRALALPGFRSARA